MYCDKKIYVEISNVIYVKKGFCFNKYFYEELLLGYKIFL